MLKLNTSDVAVTPCSDLKSGAYLLSRNGEVDEGIRQRSLFLTSTQAKHCPSGFAGFITFGNGQAKEDNEVSLPNEMSYLDDSDVVLLDPARKTLRTVYRKSSPNNSFLLTERCSHYCVMCSQPPRIEDDGYLAHELLECIPLVDKSTVEIGFTGGEPTLLGDMFFRLVQEVNEQLPQTALHILSNGRTFVDPEFARRLASIGHHDLMMGIPVYSDDSSVHNFVVQSSCALDETLNGIINLKSEGVKVEIRVVLHRYTVPTLVSLASFIARNLLFVDHVAFMGLEAMGFARSNWSDLWIDPKLYQDALMRAVEICSVQGMNVSVYNLPLCWIDPRLARFYRKSISDWKNDFDSECNQCSALSKCGGFFSSNVIMGASNGVQRLSLEQLSQFKFA